MSLKNLEPRVWDPESPYFLPDLRALMVSYGDFHRMPVQRRQAMERGVRAYLGAPASVAVYLDNGAFSFMRAGDETPRPAYAAFVGAAKPDWYAIPQDYIPTPAMSDDEQRACLDRTMAVNRAYGKDGYVPVVHVSRQFDQYVAALQADVQLRAKPNIGIGAIVPNLLRAPRAMAYGDVLARVRAARRTWPTQQLHVFGVGGTATLHLAALLGVDSVDSSGWRNRAARGIIQLPGRGDRTVANLGSWRGRELSDDERALVATCACPVCPRFGLDGLRASGLSGFCRRATHNLWVLLQETITVGARLENNSYAEWFAGHLDNSVYLPLVRKAWAVREDAGAESAAATA